MKTVIGSTLKRIPALLAADKLDTEQQLARIQSMERNIGLPIRAGIVAVLLYFLYFSRSSGSPSSLPGTVWEALFFSKWLGKATSESEVMLVLINWLSSVYLLVSLVSSVLLFYMRRVGWGVIRWVVFIVSLSDGLFLAALTLMTGGYESALYWLFLGLVIRNAVSVPVAPLQILLNLSVCVSFVIGSLLEPAALEMASELIDAGPNVISARMVLSPAGEPFLLRLVLLLLLSACCYGIQVIFDRNVRVQEEARQFQARQQQLQSAGRLAAEIAHQLKNPLAIINNAAFNLQQLTVCKQPDAAQQVQMIREEVDRSDRIITQVMGYAQLIEGKVERVNVVEEMEKALEQVFPPALKLAVKVRRNFAKDLPLLLIQRRHLSEVLVNLLLNAREATAGQGSIEIAIAHTSAERMVITVADDGPGIPPERRVQVFEPYFTTKAKGTGLGLAIVKHNTELYGGTARVESELGKGARFVLEFPTRTPVDAVK